jgi:uncharacterized protein
MTKRERAIDLLHTHLRNQRMIAHCLASEAVMRKLAKHLGEDEEDWGLCGMLHDIDVELTNAEPAIHGTKSRELLFSAGLSEDALEAIERHNEMSSTVPRNKRIHHALAAGETITGLIFATAMVYPDKKISSVKPKSVIKRMKEKLFAASVKRENIMECEQIGLSLQDFVTLSVEALAEIETELGF